MGALLVSCAALLSGGAYLRLAPYSIYIVIVPFATIGDDGSIIGVVCGSPEWWVLLLVSLPVLAACTFGLARYTVRRARRKDEIGYPYVVRST